MAVARIKEFRGRGEARFFGTSGGNYVGHRAPATVSTLYRITWPGAPPSGNKIMQITAAGVISFIDASGGSLDQAYDFGGAGAGRIITADAGAVEIAGTGGLLIDHTDPFILFQTGAVDNNWRLLADAENDFHIQQSTTQDDDASNDTWLTAFAIDAGTRQVGVNTAIPLSTLHVQAVSGAGSLRVQSDASQDITSFYNAAGTNLYAIGYDFSSLGFMIAETGFSTNPRLFIEDTTGDVGIGELVPDAKLHVTDTVAGVALLESSNANSRLGFRASATTDENQVFIGALGNGMEFGTSGSVKCVLIDDGRFGINRSIPQARLHVVESGGSKAFLSERDGAGSTDAAEFESVGSGIGLQLDMNGSGTALQIDSESTVNPLIELLPLTANIRGDIAFGTARTADPATPSEGDLWYDGTLERFKLKTSAAFSRTVVSRYGPNLGESQEGLTISAGVVTAGTPRVVLSAEFPTSDTLDTLNSSPQADNGDTILLQAATGDSITLGNGTGNMKLDGSNVLLNSINDNCLLFWNGSNWVEISRVQSAVA